MIELESWKLKTKIHSQTKPNTISYVSFLSYVLPPTYLFRPYHVPNNIIQKLSWHAALCSQLRPDPAIQRRNKTLLELVLGPDDAVKNSSSASHWQAARALLDLDNGNWGDTDRITHHCGGLFCCSGGLNETRMKLWSTILASQFTEVLFYSISFCCSMTMTSLLYTCITTTLMIWSVSSRKP